MKEMDPGIDLWYDFLIIKNGESSWQNGIIELNQRIQPQKWKT